MNEHSNLPFQFYMLGYHQHRMLDAARAFGWDTAPFEGHSGFSNLFRILQDHLQIKYGRRDYPAPLMVCCGPIPREPSDSDNLSQLRIAYSRDDGGFSVTSDGPRPLPATIDHVTFPHLLLRSSQLYPESLSVIADPIMGASYLRWRVFITFNKVTPTCFTRHKTTIRHEYNNALALLPAHLPDDLHHGIQLQPEVLIVNNRDEHGEVMEGCRFTPYFWRDNKWITPAAECGGNLGTTRRWALDKGLCEEGVIKGGSVKVDEIIVLSNGVKGFQSGIVRAWKSLIV